MIDKSKRIPSIRNDISLIPVQHNNQSWLLVQDSLGFVTPNTAFPAELEGLLSFFNGFMSWDSLNEQGLSDEDIQQFELIYEELDKHGLLYSDRFYARKNQIETTFLESSKRDPICAGSTYPTTAQAISKLFDEALAQVEPTQWKQKPKALFAPHIDFKVNLEMYAKAFKSIKSLKPRHIYLIGTSHYSGLDKKYDRKPFQFSYKDYVLPGRTLKNNHQKTEEFAEALKHSGATDYDVSHRMEHSLELHAIWASHIWKHEFTITPILIGSFDDTLYMEGSALEKQAQEFATYLFAHLEEDDFILISGDLSHIGRKFGDDLAASAFYEEVKQFDLSVLSAVISAKSAPVYKLLRSNLDAFRMCGFPPLISVLSSDSLNFGLQLSYDYWDEKEQESGVSFGSVLLF